MVLNPVRATIVNQPQDWKWSSYLPTTGVTKPPEYLTTDWILGQFSRTRKRAQELYKQFVLKGITKDTPWKDLQGQIFLGDKGFIEKCKITFGVPTDLKEIPRSQRYAERPMLTELLHDRIKQDRVLRNKAIYDAHVTYGYTLKKIADHLKIHYTTVSKVVKDEGG